MSSSSTGGTALGSPGVASAVPISKSRHWIVLSIGVVRGSVSVRALRSPMWELRLSIVPYASILGESLGSRVPPTSDVVPLSPVAVYRVLFFICQVVRYSGRKSCGQGRY